MRAAGAAGAARRIAMATASAAAGSGAAPVALGRQVGDGAVARGNGGKKERKKDGTHSGSPNKGLLNKLRGGGRNLKNLPK